MQELLIVNPSDRDGGEETLYESNPRKRRRSGRRASAKQLAWRRTFAKRYGGGHKRRASNPKKRRARRGGAVMASVKRGGHKVSRRAWRASGYRRNPRRRSYRRNPIALRATMGSIMGMLVQSAQGAVGAIGVDMVMGQAITRGWIPASMLTPTTYPVVKGGVAIGLGVLANMLPLPAMLKRFAVAGVQGSLTCTLRDTIQPYVSGSFPLGARHRPMRGMGYSMPGRVLSGRMGEYLHGGDSMATRESRMYGPGYVASQMGEYLRR